MAARLVARDLVVRGAQLHDALLQHIPHGTRSRARMRGNRANSLAWGRTTTPDAGNETGTCFGQVLGGQRITSFVDDLVE